MVCACELLGDLFVCLFVCLAGVWGYSDTLLELKEQPSHNISRFSFRFLTRKMATLLRY